MPECSCCGRKLPITEFYYNNQKKYYYGKCKECHIQSVHNKEKDKDILHCLDGYFSDKGKDFIEILRVNHQKKWGNKK